jgi:polypeptide N-acetylgalactosaminyltransferase
LSNNSPGGTLGMYKCHNDGGNQEFVLSKGEQEFRHRELCIAIDQKRPEGNPVKFVNCEDSRNRKKWKYQSNNLISEETGLCLDSVHHATKGLTAEKCAHKSTQVFKFELRNIS